MGVPTLHDDFASRMGGAGAGGGRGKQLAQQLEVLLIDEVSMLSAEFIDLLDEQMRKLVAKWGRGPEQAHGVASRRGAGLGGVQPIRCGDFFQLPPTSAGCRPTRGRASAPTRSGSSGPLGRSGRHQPGARLNRGFAFQANAWWRASLVTIERRAWQKDAALVATLNRIRKGAMTPADCRFLNAHCATPAGPPRVRRCPPPTLLAPAAPPQVALLPALPLLQAPLPRAPLLWWAPALAALAQGRPQGRRGRRGRCCSRP